MELELNGVKLKVYESGEIHRLYKKDWVLRKGSINNCGYIKLRMKTKSLSAHRIVYKAFNPDWNIHDTSRDNQIDHINRVRDDNRICNLRVVNHSQNQQNQNTKNYSWVSRDNAYIVRVRIDNKSHTKKCKTEEEAIKTSHEFKKKYLPFYERTAIPEGE